MSVVALVAAACVSITGPHIRAGDLARAVPGFRPADPAAAVSWAPQPGAVRIFQAAELRKIMTSMDPKTAVPAAGICFAIPTSPLLETDVVEAMRGALPANSKIEVVEMSHFPAPAGEVVFAVESLGSPGSDATALWRGFVRYGENAKFQVWARVKVRVPVARLIAIETLRQGKPIRASQVKLATFEDAPSNHVTAAAAELVEGHIPRRTIAANSPVWMDLLDPPMEIVRGDKVAVVVHSGLAVLSMNVEAMTSGRRGEIVSFKNPSSGKLFRARIDGPNAASVQVDPVKQ